MPITALMLGLLCNLIDHGVIFILLRPGLAHAISFNALSLAISASILSMLGV
jgi:hypothetical protein